MRIKNFEIPLVPLIAFIIMNIIYFGYEQDLLMGTHTMPECRPEESGYCKHSTLNDQRPPEITSITPEHNSVGISADTIAQFEVCDGLSGVDIESMLVSIYTPGIDDDYNEYSIEDEDMISIDPEDGCYTVDIDYPGDLPPDNTVKWWLGACDCEGNVSSLELKSSTNTSRFGVFLVEFSYYAQYLLWFVVLFGPKIFERSWGVVYDSSSKAPLSRAVVRLYQNGMLMDSQVTDVNGVFHMTPAEGTYTIIAGKSGYTFPSSLGANYDGRKKNLYYGEEFEVTYEGTPVKKCIPLDPVGETTANTYFLKVSSFFVSMLTHISDAFLLITVIGMMILWLKPPWVMETLAYSSVGIAILVIKRIVILKARGSFGKVIDVDGNVVAGLEIGLYEKEYDKLIDKKTTDDKGHYQFVVPGGSYYLRPIGTSYVLAESDKTGEKGILFEKVSDDDILIAQKIVVRKSSL